MKKQAKYLEKQLSELLKRPAESEVNNPAPRILYLKEMYNTGNVGKCIYKAYDFSLWIKIGTYIH